MPTIPVGALSFTFDDGWLASGYDDWSFYRNRFQRIRDQVKAVDLLAIDPDRTAWLIEVKDYRRHRRTKPIDLAEEVAHKVFDTLAALLPARINGDVAEETRIARAMLSARRLRVVFHLEQPTTHSKLFPRVIDPANVLMKLKQLIKPIDAYPQVVDTNRMAALAWTVTHHAVPITLTSPA
jgi:hypothetical protein